MLFGAMVEGAAMPMMRADAREAVEKVAAKVERRMVIDYSGFILSIRGVVQGLSLVRLRSMVVENFLEGCDAELFDEDNGILRGTHRFIENCRKPQDPQSTSIVVLHISPRCEVSPLP